MSVFGIDRLR